MAARLAPDNVRRMHQSLHHLVADAPWSDEAMLQRRARICAGRDAETGTGDCLDHRRHGFSQERAKSRWAWRANTAGSWASRKIAV